MRRIATALACAAALSLPGAAATEMSGKWRFECGDTAAGRHCDLTAIADLKVRGGAKGQPPITVSWEVTNTATASSRA